MAMMRRIATALVLAGALSMLASMPATAGSTQRAAAESQRVHYRSVDIDGVKVFYREAGPADAPVIVLLHGFPSSSHMFRNLIPVLASQYRVIAPDYPGFGHSDMP